MHTCIWRMRRRRYRAELPYARPGQASLATSRRPSIILKNEIGSAWRDPTASAYLHAVRAGCRAICTIPPAAPTGHTTVTTSCHTTDDRPSPLQIILVQRLYPHLTNCRISHRTRSNHLNPGRPMQRPWFTGASSERESRQQHAASHRNCGAWERVKRGALRTPALLDRLIRLLYCESCAVPTRV